MITLESALAEARSAPLYHSTTPSAGVMIIKDGSFNVDTFHMNRKLLNQADPKGITKGLSLTRNLRMAKSWANLVFELDQQKLIYKYKIAPIQFWSAHYGARRATSPSRSPVGQRKFGDAQNEYEEFVISDKPIPLKPFLRKIYVGSLNGFLEPAFFSLGVPVVDFNGRLITVERQEKLRKAIEDDNIDPDYNY